MVKRAAERELACEKLRKNEEVYRVVMKQTKHLVYD